MRLRRSRRPAPHSRLDGVAEPGHRAAPGCRAVAVELPTPGSDRRGDDRLRNLDLRIGVPVPRHGVGPHGPGNSRTTDTSMTALAISNIVLWIVVLALLVVVLALTRQLGVLH